jgi:flagellar biosynthesis/type III secretory pathway chaperone
VHSRRSRIIQLVAAIRQTHMHMVLLLTECMKVNRLLMEHLFPQAQGLALYGSSGHKRWRQSPGLVDAEL